MQVGYVGLLKAINNFDPAAGCSLATYARPCISGEIKRHFRDKRWQVRVKRPVQELVLEVREATWRLAQELGRTPAESDIARHLGVSGDDLRQARRAELAFWPSSLDAPLAGQPGMIILADVLGEEDPRLEHMLGMQAVAAHWGELPAREQKILLMDFRRRHDPVADRPATPHLPDARFPAARPCAGLPALAPARPAGASRRRRRPGTQAAQGA